MIYSKVIWFFTTYDIAVLSATFGAVWIFGAINWSINVYRKQNKKFEKSRKKICANTLRTNDHVNGIAEEYRRQWRAYVRSGAARPSLTFEFVPRKNKIYGINLIVLCTLCAGWYLAIFFLDTTRRDYLFFQFAYGLSMALVLIVNRLIFLRKEKRARKCFARFVVQLNKLAQKSPYPTPKQVAQTLQNFNRSGADDAALQKASDLLHRVGLENDRTVEEQKQINRALNGLLQAYSRSALQKR